MLHKFRATGAPRVFLLPAISLLSVGGATVLLLTGNTTIGLIVLAVSAWISYYLLRYTISQFRSHVVTDSEGMTCLTSLGVKTGMAWSDVTHGGTFVTQRGDRFFFVYDEIDDELITIPDYYSGIDQLQSRISEQVDVPLRLSGRSSDDLAAALKPLLSDPGDPP